EASADQHKPGCQGSPDTTTHCPRPSTQQPTRLTFLPPPSSGEVVGRTQEEHPYPALALPPFLSFAIRLDPVKACYPRRVQPLGAPCGRIWRVSSRERLSKRPKTAATFVPRFPPPSVPAWNPDHCFSATHPRTSCSPAHSLRSTRSTTQQP